MTTMRDIVTRAYRKAGITGVNTPLEAEYAAEGLDALNSMLHEWKLHSVDISHTDLTLSGTFPLASEYERGTVYLLAQDISPDYQMPPTFDPDEFFRVIQAAYMTIDEVTMPKALTEVPSKKERDGTLGWYL